MSGLRKKGGELGGRKRSKLGRNERQWGGMVGVNATGGGGGGGDGRGGIILPMSTRRNWAVRPVVK